MKNITEQLVEQSNGILKSSSEVTDSRFTMFDTGAVEIETGELVYGFIKRLKPQNVLSTGIYTGISDLFIAMALKENGFGHLDAVEYEKFHIDRAVKLWQTLGLFEVITPVNSDSLKFQPQKQYQFMFLDTEMNLRLHELVKFFPFLDPGGYIFIHDMPASLCFGNTNQDHPNIKNWPVGEFPEAFNNLLKTGQLKMFHFPGARGLVGFYKPKESDYKV